MPIAAIKNQVGNKPRAQAREEQSYQVDERGNRLGGQPALSVVAAIILVVQIGLMLAVLPIAAYADDPSKNYLWPPSKPSSWTDWLLVGITLAYVIATVIYVRISCKQLAEVSRANEHARDMSRAQLEETRRGLDHAKDALTQTAKAQRAWLVPEKWLSAEENQVRQSLTFRPIPDQSSPTSVPFRNIGKIPAFDAKITAKPTLVQRDGSGHLDLPDVIVGGRLVFGRDDSHNYEVWISVGAQGIIDAIEEGALVLKVRIRMTYGDPLGSEGCTEFTMTYQPSGDFIGLFTISGTFAAGDSVMR